MTTPTPDLPPTDAPGETPTKPLTASEEFAEKSRAAYQWWDNLATLNAEDPVPVMLAKIGVRIVGVLVLIGLSPLILLGFLFALLAVA